MQTINFQVKGKPLIFTNKSVTYAGREFLYSEMSNIAHRGGNQPAYIFDYQGKRLALPYDPKHKDATMKIFQQIAGLEMKRKTRTPPPAPPKETPAVSPRQEMAYTLSFSSDTPSADPISRPHTATSPPFIYAEKKKEKGFWSIGRLVIGILSIVLFIFIAFQSCAAGLINALEVNDASNGITGLVAAITLLISGIIAVCTRNSKRMVGPIIAAVFYFIGAILIFGSGATYGHLPIWGGISAVFGIVFIICVVKTKRSQQAS